MEQRAVDPMPVHSLPMHARSETIVFVALACALVIAPAFAYPVFLM